MATKKKAGTSMVRWDEELAKIAESYAKKEEMLGAGHFFSTRGGVLSFQNKPIKGNAMKVIILGSLYENSYFGNEKFDPENPRSPVCYAFSEDGTDMKPHSKSEDPQSEACKECPMNEWGSSDRGEGKACKNIRRLAVIPAEYDKIEEAEMGFLKIPVTSVKAWKEYVNALAESLRRPPWAVATEIRLVPDKEKQFLIEYTHEENVPNEYLSAVQERIEEALKALNNPYPENQKRVEKLAKPSKKPARGEPGATRKGRY